MKLNSEILSSKAIFRDGELEYSAFEGGYFEPEGGTMYYFTDWQGNNAAVANSKGDRVQHTTYYPYGEPKATSTGAEVNPFKYGGKELNTDLVQPFYDFEARMQLPQLCLFQRPDPKASDYTWLNPFTYCAGDPINKIDPDGKDAKVSFDGKTLTVKAVIILIGEKADENKARIYKDDIMNMWGKINEFSYGGESYSVKWDVDVRVKHNEEIDYNGVNNYMEVKSEMLKNRSNVKDMNHGEIRGEGRYGLNLVEDSPMSHEFGHMLGLKDKYNDDCSIPLEWTNDIMAEPTYQIGRTISKEHINKLFTPIIQIHKISDALRKIPVLHWFIPKNTIYYINKYTRADK